jgi:hypothetical protein
VQFADKLYTWTFLKADVEHNILGIDFFKKFNLVVDANTAGLIDTKTMKLAAFADSSAATKRGGAVLAAVAHTPPALRDLLVSYQAVLNAGGDLPPVKHQVQHHLLTAGCPVTARFRRLDPEKLAAAKASFAKMERQGVVRRSDSCWSSPLHMVKKDDGSYRPCGDYRLLNNITQPDKYPLPRMEDLTGKLAGCTVFSKLDLKQGYNQIPMAEEDIKKTAVITPFGLFEFLRMPFGLKNAGMTFQRMMDNLVRDLGATVVYLDDMLVASPDMATHHRDLQLLFLFFNSILFCISIF